MKDILNKYFFYYSLNHSKFNDKASKCLVFGDDVPST